MSAYDLIRSLDKAYPHRCISPLDTLEGAHREAGRRALIDELVAAMASEEVVEAAPVKTIRRRASRKK